MKQFLCIAMVIAGLQSAVAQTSPHGTIRFSCDLCHTTDSWKMRPDAQFSHAATGFDLTGMHTTVECRGCHQGLKFSSARRECQSCHIDVHKGELGSDCLRCHTTKTSKIVDMIERHQQTRFPLLGRHAAAPCEACHARSANQQYTGTPTTCIGCHRNEYQGTQNPNHLFAGFSTDCAQCHVMNAPSWIGSFNHQLTVFPLTGAHQSVPCSKCHTTNSFKSTSQECYSCHASEYAAVQSPNHAAGSFSHQCVTCHTTTVWKPATFDHAATRFALTGKHASALCSSCHVNDNYRLTYSDCYACHQVDFQKPTNPNHIAGSFVHACDQCHTTTVWTPSTFNHSSTPFALLGAHQAVACANCHVNNVYAGLHKNCIDCHQADYANTTSPKHATPTFSTLCTQCHSMTGWKPASFDHTATKFALTGKHTTTACVACHVSNNYQLVYIGCYQCHSRDYQGTTNPNHSSAAFPTTCETCHSTTTWTGAAFNHTRFPLSHGNANGVCNACHTNSSNYSVFQCTVCHTKAKTDQQHSGKANYVWNSTDCYSCHPSGRSD
jgi:hypothetical protein